MSFETGNRAARANGPPLSSGESHGIEIEFVGRLPTHFAFRLALADVGSVRTNGDKTSGAEIPDRRTISAWLRVGELPRFPQVFGKCCDLFRTVGVFVVAADGHDERAFASDAKNAAGRTSSGNRRFDCLP